MQATQALPHKAGLPLAPVHTMAQVRESNFILMLGLLYAVAISPFIGGVRGWPCTLGWLIPPALWLWQIKKS